MTRDEILKDFDNTFKTSSIYSHDQLKDVVEFFLKRIHKIHEDYYRDCCNCQAGVE